MSTIGNNIKNRRLEKRMTLEDLARAIGTSKQTIQRYESGVIGNIPSDKIEALAAVLDVTPAYLMGWEESTKLQPPTVTENYVTFPVIGELAAGYENVAVEDWSSDTIDVPVSYLKGHKKEDFFVLSIKGDSMYPLYHEGDRVLILKQNDVDYSGAIGAVIYDDELATIKKVEKVHTPTEDYIRLQAINPNYAPKEIRATDLDHFHILGVPKLLIRDCWEK